MKKAKIMLTAITVLAVVGGALAFKAKKTATILCSDNTANAALCKEFVGSTWTSNQGVISYCTTEDVGQKCDVPGRFPVAD